MAIYFKLTICFTVVLYIIGVQLPALFSSPSDADVLVGIVTSVLLVPWTYYSIKMSLKK